MEKIKEILKDKKNRMLCIIGAIIVAIILITLIVFLVNGKDKTKVILCEYNAATSESNAKIELKYNEEKGIIISAKTNIERIFASSDEVELYAKADLCETYSGDSDIYKKCSSKTDKNKIIIELENNLEYSGKSEAESELYLRENMTIDQIKEFMKEKDYTCNID